MPGPTQEVQRQQPIMPRKSIQRKYAESNSQIIQLLEEGQHLEKPLQ